MAMDVGKAAADTVVIVGELFVIEAEQVERGGVEIIDGDRGFGRLIAEIVGGAVGRAGLDAGTGEPAGEAVGVMIATLLSGALRNGCAAEFGDAHDEGVLQQAALVKVVEQSGHGLIIFTGHLAVVAD